MNVLPPFSSQTKWGAILKQRGRPLKADVSPHLVTPAYRIWVLLLLSTSPAPFNTGNPTQAALAEAVNGRIQVNRIRQALGFQ
jgi:hypothetical protein